MKKPPDIHYSRYDEANPNLKEQGDIVLYADEVLHIPGLGFDGVRPDRA